MKTQINDLINGSQFVAGTNQAIRNERGEQVLKENGASLKMEIAIKRGSLFPEFELAMSTTGKSWYYVSKPLSDVAAYALGYDMSIYKYQHQCVLILYSDMRLEFQVSARKSDNHEWKFRSASMIDNSNVAIL